MIDLEEIERTIDEIEHTHDTTFRTCERLAWLYVCRDHLREQTIPSAKVSTETAALGGSDFLDACDGIPYGLLMQVISEHMDVIKVLYPKEYRSLIDKILALKN